jgi:hypothetical protein
MTGSPRIEDLPAEARYHRHSYDLYRAQDVRLRLTTMTRLTQLERAEQDAEARLRRGATRQRSPTHAYPL